MLAGEMAFDGHGSVTDVARRVLTHQPPFIAGLSQALNEVLFRGMARAAADRFSSVAELVAAMRAAVAAVAAPAPSVTADELPPLPGEVTRITTSGDAPADEDDPVAPPPEDVAPSKEPRTPTIKTPTAILHTLETAAIDPPKVTAKTMPAVTAPDDWDAVAGDTTRSIAVRGRWRWFTIGLVVALIVAALLVFLPHG
jgi:hypothetical protein